MSLKREPRVLIAGASVSWSTLSIWWSLEGQILLWADSVKTTGLLFNPAFVRLFSVFCTAKRPRFIDDKFFRQKRKQKYHQNNSIFFFFNIDDMCSFKKKVLIFFLNKLLLSNPKSIFVQIAIFYYYIHNLYNEYNLKNLYNKYE